MSSYASLRIKGKEVMSFRNSVEPTFMFLFRQDELVRTVRAGEDQSSLGDAADEEYDACEFIVSARNLRDRLDILGIGRTAVEAGFAEIVRSGIERYERNVHPPSDLLDQLYAQEANELHDLTYDRWIYRVREELDGYARYSPARGTPGTVQWLIGLWDYHDTRWVLRAFADVFPEELFILDVTELENSGRIQPDTAPRQAAIENFSWAMENGAPPIVLAEGRTDINILSAAVSLRRPHLDGFLRFADFSFGPEGGAPALVRTIRTFASAGIINRVVAIFDNDTAAADALRALDGVTLPPNIVVMQLPHVSWAENYPTRGPSGLASMDVNGVAGSIELYLGSDVLRDQDGSFRPVQWTGYVSRIGRYQGELVDKQSILTRFDAKLASVRSDPMLAETQDWAGLDAILDAIQAKLSRAE